MSHDIAGELFAFLTEPATYGEDTQPVEVIETHAACVFLCGSRALKVKKNVAYPYLDFSTRELRAGALSREIELNAQNAPDLYLGIIEIRRAGDGRLTLGGAGETIESALHMRRFEQNQLLDRLAASGHLELTLMGPLANAIACAHDQSPIIDGFDQVTALCRVLDGNIASLGKHDALFPSERTGHIARRSREELERASPVLTERARQGFVRRCHGDLHLGNIVVWQGRPTLFDALEFDEELASIDVLYDLAFLLMDLVHRDLKRHANALANFYLARAQPDALAGLAALPAMISLRAAIRAKVEADKSEAIDEPVARCDAAAAAKSYFDLADACLAPFPPRLVAIGGLSGSGKSTIAAEIAARLNGPSGALLLRSDVERKALAGVAITERLAAESYTPDAARAVYRRLLEKAGVALGAGSSVVVDAVHASTQERDCLAEIAQRARVPFGGLWLDAEADVLKARVMERKGDASDADAGVLERQLSYDLGEIEWARINAGGSIDETIGRAWRALGLDR